jgi:hypothetical protein
VREITKNSLQFYFSIKNINFNKNITDNMAEIFRDPWAVAIFIRPTSKKWA